MLADAVGKGSWPNSKLQLYKKAVKILLTEHNRVRIGLGLGQYSPEELMDPAGAVCASVLISGVEGINLLESSLDNNYPSYCDVPYEEIEKVQACLMMRAFSLIGSKQEAVTYVHRTVAEYLGARWLSKKIHHGFPFRRLLSLISIEEHPAPELRGLHAWLATLLSDNSINLIKNDPYGVLVYGDPRSLSLSSRKLLLDELKNLSKQDPWFRSSELSARSLGALSGKDMVRSFRRILNDPNSGFTLKSIVFDSIRNGPLLPEMGFDMKRIFMNLDASYHERCMALDALVHVIPNGESDVVKSFKSTLAGNPATARLRSEVLSLLFDKYFNPDDVVSVLQDILEDTEKHSIGTISLLPFSLPIDALPEILDCCCELRQKESSYQRGTNEFEVGITLSHMIATVLKHGEPIQSIRLWSWLKTLHRFEGGTEEDIKEYLIRNKSIVFEMFKIAFNELHLNRRKWLFLHDFQETTMFSLSGEEMANYTLRLLYLKNRITEKDRFLYEITSQLIMSSAPVQEALFRQYYLYADREKSLQKIRDNYCRCKIEEWRREAYTRKLEDLKKRDKIRKKNRAALYQTKESIKNGKHVHNLDYLSHIYFGLSYDSDLELTPFERLRNEIGDDLVDMALEGFTAIIKRNDLPSPTYIASLLCENLRSLYCYAVLAGMDEVWKREGILDIFPDALLKFALVIAILFPTLENTNSKNIQSSRQWKGRIYTERPDIAESVFEEIARVFLHKNNTKNTIFYNIASNHHTERWRGRLALRLLKEFPAAKPESFQHLILAALYEPDCHKELVKLAKLTLGTRGLVRMETRALWLIAGFLLSCDEFVSRLLNYTKNHEWVIWTIRDIYEQTCVRGQNGGMRLSEKQIEALIVLVGEEYENTPFPMGASTGNQNAWNASEFVQKNINKLAAIPKVGASYVLKNLLGNKRIASYHNMIKHSYANQAAIHRETEYSQPDWNKTIETLGSGSPANISDLHAIVLDHISTIKSYIRYSNTDPYKQFWRCDSNGKVEHPVIENICRDRLIELLRTRLSPFELCVEPEGHMMKDRRSDIVVLSGGSLKLPLELKRDTHRDLWTACQTQLERMYVRDPNAAGYGIYTVFWFGDKRKGSMPLPPSGMEKAKSAEGLESALRKLIPKDKRYCLEAVVIDVTPPE